MVRGRRGGVGAGAGVGAGLLSGRQAGVAQRIHRFGLKEKDRNNIS